MQNSTLTVQTTDEMQSTNVNLDCQSASGTITAGGPGNIDLILTDDCFITGGDLITNGAVFGDFATMQVVDVNNILGKGAGLVLGQYVTNWVMKADAVGAQLQCELRSPYPAKIPAGLALRLVYNSTGSNNVQVAINYILHKALY
jgi:hypothetical protein